MISSAVISTGGAIIVALVKLVPARGPALGVALGGAAEDKCHRRMSALETRVAVVENSFSSLGRSFDDLKREIHEMRQELRQSIGGRRAPGEN